MNRRVVRWSPKSRISGRALGPGVKSEVAGPRGPASKLPWGLVGMTVLYSGTFRIRHQLHLGLEGRLGQRADRLGHGHHLRRGREVTLPLATLHGLVEDGT